MDKLIAEVNQKINQLDQTTELCRELRQCLSSDIPPSYPFNKFEYVISTLLATNNMTQAEYLNLRSGYLQRNPHLTIYEIREPRYFGETWAYSHLREMVPELVRPSTAYDPKYSGQYDLWYQDIRIEVKASRAVKSERDSIYIQNALRSDSDARFAMNFQQIKPDCCDVLVLIAVWLDKIRYWVLSSDEVRNNRYYSPKQHRGNTGEGQLWLRNSNIDLFAEFEVGVCEILKKIVEKGSQKEQA